MKKERIQELAGVQLNEMEKDEMEFDFEGMTKQYADEIRKSEKFMLDNKLHMARGLLWHAHLDERKKM